MILLLVSLLYGDPEPAGEAFADEMKITRPDFPMLSATQGPDLPGRLFCRRRAARFGDERSPADQPSSRNDEETVSCGVRTDGYRLPTETRWEYAHRAGMGINLSRGNAPNRPMDFAWFNQNSPDRIHPVGRKGHISRGSNGLRENLYDRNHCRLSPPEHPTRGPAAGTFWVGRSGFDSNAPPSSSRSPDNPRYGNTDLSPETLESRRPSQGEKAPTGFLYDEIFLEHRTGEGHPEQPARIEVIARRLRQTGLWEKLLHFRASPAALEWVHQIHSPVYTERLRKAGEHGTGHIDTRDCPISPRTFEVALAAAGGVINVLDAVLEGRIRNAFCAVRPPGHHALREKAMGFCYLNHVAIAARYLQKKHGLGRVLIVDWDVHHGNGTQDAFYEDGSVMYFSTHQHPFYPGTGLESERGAGKGEGLIINVPLPAGAEDGAVLKAYEERLRPAAETFRPDFVLVSCGFDSHRGDRLGRFALTTECFAKMTRIVKEIAGRHARGRLVSLLEGGYSLENLAAASEVHVRALME